MFLCIVTIVIIASSLTACLIAVLSLILIGALIHCKLKQTDTINVTSKGM